VNAIVNMARLTKAGATLAWSGARVLPDDARVSGPLAVFGRVTAPLRKGVRTENEARLSSALTSLGPSYIKLGQFLATRDDIVGRELARDLSTLQDRLPPFSQDEAVKLVEAELEAPITELHFSADGRFLLTVAFDNVVRLWREDGTLVAAYAHPSDVLSARFSPDGQQLITACADGRARIWWSPALIKNWLEAATVYELSREDEGRLGL